MVWRDWSTTNTLVTGTPLARATAKMRSRSGEAAIGLYSLNRGSISTGAMAMPSVMNTVVIAVPQIHQRRGERRTAIITTAIRSALSGVPMAMPLAVSPAQAAKSWFDMPYWCSRKKPS